MNHDLMNSTSTNNEMTVVELEKSLMDCSDLFDQSIYVLSDISNRAKTAGCSLNSLRLWDDRNEATATAINVLFDVNYVLELLVSQMQNKKNEIGMLNKCISHKTGAELSIAEYDDLP
jgi:hypothetical protein